MDNKKYIFGKSVLTIPDFKVSIKPVRYEAIDDTGRKLVIIGYSFGTASTLQRTPFNKRVCYSLSRIGNVLYHYIGFNLKYNYNVIQFSYNDVSSETGLNIRNVPRAIDELLELKVIFKTTAMNIYVVNPKCITNCNAREFERLYHSVEEECNVRVNDKNELIYSYKNEIISD